MKNTTNSTDTKSRVTKKYTKDTSSTKEKSTSNYDFFDLDEEYLAIENDEFLAIKHHPMAKNLGIIYNKETKTAYATYGHVALIELQAKTAEAAIVEINTRRVEIVMEFIAYTMFMSNQNKK